MAPGSDVLFQLRQVIKAKKAISYKNGSATVSSISDATHLVLSSSVSLPKTTPTRLRKPGASSTDPQANPHDFISLGAVYLAWLLRDASGAEYMKQVRENGFTTGFVSVTERKGVVDWLEEKTQSLSGLVSAECKSFIRASAWRRNTAYSMVLYRMRWDHNGPTSHTYTPRLLRSLPSVQAPRTVR